MENFTPKQRELAQVLIDIRRCQNLCQESQKVFFADELTNLGYANDIVEKVKREKPQETQKKLIIEMRRLDKEIGDKAKTSAVIDYVDSIIRI